jgi:DsbC/DsbD-like thiol-disulfide interchange protein
MNRKPASRNRSAIRRVTMAHGCVLALMLAAVLPLHAQKQVPNFHSRVELVAEKTAVVPGERLWVGVHFVMDPGWHIYWVNPGDSGQPPEIRWRLPAGFRAGEPAWPAPEWLGQGTVINYGYANDVLLLVPLIPPAKAASRDPVRLAADVNWLVCRDICITANAGVHLDLPVAGRAGIDSRSRSLFARARARLPKPAPRRWRTTAVDAGSHLVLTVRTGRRQTSARFFPLVPDQVDNARKQVANPLPGGVRLTLQKSDLLLKPIGILKGVLELGEGRAYVLSVPVARSRN